LARKSKRKSVPRNDQTTPKTIGSIMRRLADERLIVGIILVAASILLLANLGNQYLWQDEAQTACVARTILTHGIPLGADEKNSFSQEWGAEFGKNLVWRWQTWLPFYILAGFFAAFGTSNFVCRLPFALFGIASVVMGYYLGKTLWGTRRTGVLTAVLLLLCVPFLVLMRECRYYSMAVFFSMWGLYAYMQILERRKHAALWFAIAAVLLFQSLYIYYGVLLATVVIHSAIFRRDRLKTVLLASVITGLINLPWVIWLSGANFRGSLSYIFKAEMLKKAHGIQLMVFGRYYLKLMWRHIFPWFIYPIPLIISTVHWIREGRFPKADPKMWNRIVLLLLFIALNWLAVSQLSPFPHFRYLAPMIPAFWLMGALMLDRAMRFHPAVGFAVLALLFFAGTSRGYLYEITHDYDGPVEGTVKYLLAHGRDSDVVIAPREEMPLKWYTKMRVIGGITDEKPNIPTSPDWVILRTVMPLEKAYAQLVTKRVDFNKYDMITLLGYPDIPFENREEPRDHLFRTVTNPRVGPLQILRRARD